ncbi:MAG: hypothetical protein EBT22_09615, partial [Chloroflexi bacterium]|nr:hypothetical protein [Chloroflexota bacterium]
LVPVLAAGIGGASSACDAIQELVPPTPTREPGGAGTPEAVASPTATPRPAVTINPATLPGKLVFVSDANIAVWERGSMRKLTGDRISRQPTWSPDGTRIALVKLDVNSSDIWLMNADGANARQLTRNESRILNQNSWAFRPTWWPDGSRLLFLGEETTNDLMVWEIGLDGRNKKPFLIARDYDGGLDRPGVTPDGKTVVLVSYRAGGGKAQVWSTSVPNGPWKQLTEHADGAYDPCLSPDGTRIAYTVRSQSSHDIWVMNMLQPRRTSLTFGSRRSRRRCLPRHRQRPRLANPVQGPRFQPWNLPQRRCRFGMFARSLHVKSRARLRSKPFQESHGHTEHRPRRLGHTNRHPSSCR